MHPVACRTTVAIAAASAIAAGIYGLAPAPVAGGVTVKELATPLAIADTSQVAETADAVVIARVETVTGQGTHGGLPATRARVHVGQTLKGTLGGRVEVTQLGGLDEGRGRLVLVRDDTLLRPGQTYLLGLVERGGVKLVIPVGGDRPLTSSPGQSTPWTDYPAVASMLTALEAIAPSPGWEDVLQAHGSLPRLG